MYRLSEGKINMLTTPTIIVVEVTRVGLYYAHVFPSLIIYCSTADDHHNISFGI